MPGDNTIGYGCCIGGLQLAEFITVGGAVLGAVDVPGGEGVLGDVAVLGGEVVVDVPVPGREVVLGAGVELDL